MKKLISFITAAGLMFANMALSYDTHDAVSQGVSVITAYAENERVEMTKGAGQVLPDGDYMIKSSLNYGVYITTDEKVYT